jgi:alpha-1,2-mannosyltransferase
LWIITAAVVFAAVTAEIFGRRYSFFDMRIYHGAVLWWTSGEELYEFIAPNTDLGFTYPPFAAVTMLPMAGMSSTAAGWINLVASVAALGVILAVLLFPIADRMGWPRWLAIGVALPLALALEPGRETLGFGQVNLLLFGLVMADLVALRWRAYPPAALAREAGPDSVASGRANANADRVAEPATGQVIQAGTEALRRFWFSGAWAGAGIGLATAVKLTPGLFIVYLLVSRQWRAALVASGTAAGATLAGLTVAPRETLAYFTSVLWQTDRVGAVDFTPNQSLAGILARLYDQPDAPTLLWVSFAAVCCALGLSRAVHAHADGDEVAAFTLVGLTAVVISPISWSHHLVFVIPAIVVLGDAALRRRAAGRTRGMSLAGVRYASAAVATYVVFLISPIWWVRHRLPEGSHYDSGLWGVLAENSLALATIMLVAAMPWRHTPRRSRAYVDELVAGYPSRN